jgi:hypothetical protein
VSEANEGSSEAAEGCLVPWPVTGAVAVAVAVADQQA